MKILKTSAIIVLLAFITNASAQVDERIRRVHVHDVYLLSGVLTSQTTNATLSEFLKMAPESELLSRDFTGFKHKGWSYGMDIYENNAESIMLGLEFGNKDRTAYRPNPQLRLGFSHYRRTLLQETLLREDRFAYDTLISQRDGEMAYVDSISERWYDIQYFSEQIRIDASLLFSTDPQARWTLFAGIGFTAGVSLNSGLKIKYHQSSWQETTYSDDRVSYNYAWDEHEEEEEEIKQDGNFGMSIYVPMGVGFRVGKEKEFWKRIQLFYEVRPGLNINTIADYGSVQMIGSQHGIGMRVRW